MRLKYINTVLLVLLVAYVFWVPANNVIAFLANGPNVFQAIKELNGRVKALEIKNATAASNNPTPTDN